MTFMMEPDTLCLAHQWVFYRSLWKDLRVTMSRATDVRLNHRQLRLFDERYVYDLNFGFASVYMIVRYLLFILANGIIVCTYVLFFFHV
jgi:hypothetical protein